MHSAARTEADADEVAGYWQWGIGVALALRVVRANRRERAVSNRRRVGHDEAAGGDRRISAARGVRLDGLSTEGPIARHNSVRPITGGEGEQGTERGAEWSQSTRRRGTYSFRVTRTR